jgi:hypothetical protein
MIVRNYLLLQNIRESKELERAKSEKMQAEIQELTNTLDDFRNSHIGEPEVIFTHVGELKAIWAAILVQ